MKLDLFQKREEAVASLLAIEESFKNLSNLKVKDFDPEKTAIVFVDMVKGFVNVGPLSSERALDILEPIKELNENTEGYHKIYFIDYHTKDSVEFEAYVPHCIEGTEEVDLVKELIPDSNQKAKQIHKNCTNGFMAPDFQKWLQENPEVTNFIITGLVTDICVMTFALTLKTYFNEKNIKSRLMIPLSAVETFDLPDTNHQAELMNVFALYNLRMNGIELYQDFSFKD